jgi:3,4-dihydroxy 2-butanone 4-phosphate synthase/GTP cyclohydrolase II
VPSSANGEGPAARLPALLEFVRRHGLLVLRIDALVAHRRRHGRLVERVAEARLLLDVGEFRSVAFRDDLGGEHLALVHGDPTRYAGPPLVRMHSECLTRRRVRILPL